MRPSVAQQSHPLAYGDDEAAAHAWVDVGHVAVELVRPSLVTAGVVLEHAIGRDIHEQQTSRSRVPHDAFCVLGRDVKHFFG